MLIDEILNNKLFGTNLKKVSKNVNGKNKQNLTNDKRTTTTTLLFQFFFDTVSRDVTSSFSVLQHVIGNSLE